MAVKHYTGTWESIQEHGVPKWYDAAKFGIFIIGFSRLSTTEFFVFRKMEACETKNHLLCGWCSKCL